MTWTGNIIVTKVLPSTGVSTQVTIGTTSDSETLNNMLIYFTPAKTSVTYDQGKADTRIVDLLRIEERITFDGHLATGLGVGDTSTNASDKKTDLKNIFKAGGVLTITYEGSSFNVIIERLDITREHLDGSEPGTGEAGFLVKGTFLKGVNMTGGNP